MINIPPEIAAALAAGSPLIVSVSGGKDGQAMIYELDKLRKLHGWTGRFIGIHADLGEVEWKHSKAMCAKHCQEVGAEFVVVARPIDLITGIEKRHVARPEVPPWPSSAARYCTSDWKRNEINKWLRNEFPDHVTVVSCIGYRREESPARRKKQDFCINDLASAPTKERNIIQWHPILDFTLEQVWASIGYSMDQLRALQAWAIPAFWDGVPLEELVRDCFFKAHPAYLIGNERVSCVFCILASKNDLQNGAMANPELHTRYVALEVKSGFAFQQGKPLSAVLS